MKAQEGQESGWLERTLGQSLCGEVIAAASQPSADCADLAGQLTEYFAQKCESPEEARAELVRLAGVALRELGRLEAERPAWADEDPELAREIAELAKRINGNIVARLASRAAGRRGYAWLRSSEALARLSLDEARRLRGYLKVEVRRAERRAG